MGGICALRAGALLLSSAAGPLLDSAMDYGCGLTQGPIFGGTGLISNILESSTAFISAKHCGC